MQNTPTDFLTTVNSQIHQIQSALVKAPPGSLNIKCPRGSNQYYQRMPAPNGKCIYIPKENIALIRALAQKDYDRKALKILQKRAAEAGQLYAQIHTDSTDRPADPVLFSQLFQSLDSLYEKMSADRQALIKPVIPTTTQFVRDWLSEPYERLGFRETNHTRYESKGLGRVRSKSELYIADRIYYGRYPAKMVVSRSALIRRPGPPASRR